MFMALVSPKFLGSRINCACGKSVSRCALPSLEPLSTTMIWSVSRPSDFSRDSRQRRNRAARLRETTTTDTRGGCFSCSGFCGGVKPHDNVKGYDIKRDSCRYHCSRDGPDRAHLERGERHPGS